MAARALADCYQRVTVLDRDALPQDPAPRKDYPPTDDAGFLELARELDDPAIHDWLVRAKPWSPAVTYRYPAHLRRHYSGLSRFPEGLVVCGDALCSFNPIYGQAMTAGALEVLALQNRAAPWVDPPTNRP